MGNRRVALLALAGASLLTVAACSGVSTGQTANSATGSGSGSTTKYDVTTSWGTFHLASRIQQKLQQHATMNAVLSINSLTIPIYTDSYKYALPLGIAEASQKYGVKLDGKLVGPVSVNVAQQVSQIQQAVAANQVDCLGVAGGDPALGPEINQLANQGIPVFTIGVDIPGSHALSGFQADYTHEGDALAEATVAFFKAKNIPLKHVAMTSGQSTATWAQQRMQAYQNRLTQLDPGVDFVNTSKTALNTGFSNADVYSDVHAYLVGHPDVQVVYQTDTGATTVAKVVSDLNMGGKTFVVGHNPDLNTFRLIQQGAQIASADQDFIGQAKFAGLACGALLGAGQVLPKDSQGTIVTNANVAQAQQRFMQATGGH
jgi:ABC-type sugar transport system substrate-binding protein